MSTESRKRLIRDFKHLQNDPPHGIFGSPDENNLLLWNVVICGPADTIWEGGTFRLTLEFPNEYPNKPPEVKFVSKMFHPNGMLIYIYIIKEISYFFNICFFQYIIMDLYVWIFYKIIGVPLIQLMLY